MKLTMRLGADSYDIIISRGALGHLAELTDLSRRKVFIVTDSGVPAQYAETVRAQCADGCIFTVPQGEGSKSLKVYTTVLQAMLEFGMTRADLVVAVGGGVVGDMAGFAAATYMRGIQFINCPTTTLSQFDSSIGGKVAVDLGETKNIVGAFWQPKLVVIDPDTLDTLPRRQYVNGLAEALKMGLIADPELFDIFENEDPFAKIEEVIYHSLIIKKNIVERDVTEKGDRAALNFGHTLGHGIEAVRGIRGRRTRGFYHGECVALGMLPMIEDAKLKKRVRAVYRKLGLPLTAGYDKAAALEARRHDKKTRGGKVKLVKVPGVGCWRIDTVDMAVLETLVLGKPIPPMPDAK